MSDKTITLRPANDDGIAQAGLADAAGDNSTSRISGWLISPSYIISSICTDILCVWTFGSPADPEVIFQGFKDDGVNEHLTREIFDRHWDQGLNAAKFIAHMSGLPIPTFSKQEGREIDG